MMNIFQRSSCGQCCVKCFCVSSTDALQNADSRAELERKNHVMVVHPRQASLPLNSVIVTLYYCCRYHFGEPEVLCTISSLLQLLNKCFSSLLIVQ